MEKNHRKLCMGMNQGGYEWNNLSAVRTDDRYNVEIEKSYKAMYGYEPRGYEWK